MARRVRAVSHEDRLTLVEHLDELRNRDHRLPGRLRRRPGALLLAEPPAAGNRLRPAAERHKKLLTFGVTEPFTTTLTVAAYGAIILSLPVSLYQAYAYVLPAFSDAERRVVLPIMLLAPFLFLAGVAFAYFVVMPAAVKFLLNFNDSQFNVQVRARDYYSFFSMTMLAGGIVFQLPLAILAVTRLGIVSVAQLSANRRYAYLVIAVVAAALPGVDPVSMLIEMVPLLALYELSILLARAFGRPRAAGGMAKPSTQEQVIEMAEAASGGCSSTPAGKRKHVVRVVYAILALLMGASLFLVVGPVNIGELLGDASSTTSASKVLDEQAERIERRLAKNPKNEALLLGADPGADLRPATR